MPVYFDKTARRWRFEFDRIINGQRVRATKLLPPGWTRTQVQNYEQREAARLFALASHPSEQRRLIEDAVELYCKEKMPELKGAKKQLGDFAQCHWVYAGRYMDELADVAREYATDAVQEVKGKDGGVSVAPLSPATIKKRMAYLRAACRYAFKHHGFGQHDPAERMTLPSPRNERHHYCTRAEMLKVAAGIDNRGARIAVLTAFYSGMRLGEILRAKIVDGHFLLEDTKNGDRRAVPIHGKLVAYLGRFPLPVADRTVQGCFKRAATAIGMPHLRFHDLRHSAASEMVNAGIDLYTVGGVLGHKSPQSTKRYAHLATGTLSAAIQRIGKKRLSK